ncbi:hypothetical protein GIB67_036232, partial [Kingdonia uniflora]
ISHYGRLLILSIRSLTETYNIALQVYMLSRGSLIELINSTWPRHAIQIFNIQYFSLRSLIDLQHSSSSIHALPRVAY